MPVLHFLFVVIIFVVSPAVAEETRTPEGGWTLIALSERALERSIAVRAAEAELEAARLLAPASSTWDRPEVSVGGGVVTERDGAESGAGPVAEMSVTQVLARPSTRRARAAAAESQVAAARVEVDRSRAEIRVEVARRMIRLTAAQIMRRALAAHHGRLATALESLAGRGSAVPAVALEVSTLAASVRLAAARAERARGDVDDAWLELEELVHLHAAAPPALAFSLPDALPEPDAEALAGFARAGAFPVRVLAATAVSASVQADLDRRAARPAISISPFVSRSSALGTEMTAGLGIGFPLPGGRAARARTESSAHFARAAALRLDLERHLAGHHVEHLAARYASARRRCALFALAALPTLAAEGEEGQLQFLAGRIPLAVFIAAQDMYAEVVEETVNAQYDAAAAWVDLAYAAGREVVLP